MIYLGIDIAKLNHCATAISSDDEIRIKPFCSTLQMTMMASICCFLNWHHLTRTASS